MSPFSRWADVRHRRDLAAAVVAVLWMIFLLWIYPVLR